MTPKWKPSDQSRVWVIASAGAFIVVGGAAILWAPAPLLDNWLPNGTAEERGRVLGTAAQIVLFSLGGLIAIVGVTLSVLRHREELKTAERDGQRHADDRAREESRQREIVEQRKIDAERELRSRFVTAVDLLSQSAAIKRTAGIYALGALADDWAANDRSDETQVCIDVICGYLRAPLEEGTTRTSTEEREIKTTAVRLIRDHLRVDAGHSWAAMSFRLTGMHVDFQVDLSGVVLSDTLLDLQGATVTRGGRIDLSRATITNRSLVAMQQSAISDSGKLFFESAVITGGSDVDLTGTTIDEGEMSMDGASIDHGSVLLTGATIGNQSKVVLTRTAVSPRGSIWLESATISDHSVVTLRWAKIGEEVDTADAADAITQVGDIWDELSTWESGSTAVVDFMRVTLSGESMVDLVELVLQGRGAVGFVDATIVDTSTVRCGTPRHQGLGALSSGKLEVPPGWTVEERPSLQGRDGFDGRVALPDGSRLRPPARQCEARSGGANVVKKNFAKAPAGAVPPENKE